MYSTPSSINHKNHLCSHRYPFTPGWREAILVKHLAQGHKCHDQDSNPHTVDSELESVVLDCSTARLRQHFITENRNVKSKVVGSNPTEVKFSLFNPKLFEKETR